MLVFQALGGATGVAFTLPLVLFLFVVALGTDYNILMTARLREEMLAGARRARPWPKPSGTWLRPSPPPAWSWRARSGRSCSQADEGARQMGFAMALGILIASLVVSSVLVPALSALLGRRAWWPNQASGSRRPVARESAAGVVAEVSR